MKSILRIISLSWVLFIGINQVFGQIPVDPDLHKVKIKKRLSLEKKLGMLPGVTIKSAKYDSTLFEEAYELYFTQPVDHRDPAKGTFQQQVWLSHKSEKAPMVMYLNGYIAGSNKFISELTTLLDANQIHVEHRYFGKSIPAGDNYEYLNIEQAAADQQRILLLLKNIYKGPWVSSGISKGGSTTMYHRSFYPDAVKASVPYVGPLTLAAEDQRIYDFFGQVGSSECRERLVAYQKDLLENRWEVYPLFLEFNAKKEYTYDIPIDQVLELSVLELGFSFWQWDGDCSHLPADTASIRSKVKYLFQVDAPSFFDAPTIKAIFPFFYQAYAEVGMYGYDTRPFGELMTQYDGVISNYRTFIPEGIDIKYQGDKVQQVRKWLDKNGDQFIYVYGEVDPWTATAYKPTKDVDALFYEKKGGNHGTRIQNLSEKEQQEIFDALEKWTGVKVTGKFPPKRKR